ncbi:hypothetical protein ACIQH5_15070, partial [Paenarthrobacter sp. NPDC091711]|uniref:hypothetical protein n=1 Tax=Paenarthrobacter sp. NPDC091711 TaxID=3364385 RepID=UPI0037F875AB
TIGINKLGTLLSSQTTGHYSKAVPTRTLTGPRIAPEQLFKLTRPSRTKQTKTRASHTNQKHTKALPEPVN